MMRLLTRLAANSTRNKTALMLVAISIGLLIICMIQFFYPFSKRQRKLAVFFGDSITQHAFNPETQGFLAHMSVWWTRRVDVINRGFSGYNSRWGLAMLPGILKSLNPDLLVIFFGANDAIDVSVIQHVPLLEYEKNMKEMVMITSKIVPLCQILLITPPPVWETELEIRNALKGKSPLKDRSNERTKLYAETVITVSKSLGVHVVDAWSGLGGDSVDRANFLSDGLHLNARGNLRILELLKQTIRANLRHWDPEVLPLPEPLWSEINHVF